MKLGTVGSGMVGSAIVCCSPWTRRERAEVEDIAQAVPFAGSTIDQKRCQPELRLIQTPLAGLTSFRSYQYSSTKKEVRIFDYVDRTVPMLRRMFEKRLRGYRGIG
jgi:hypothetical protein